MAKGGGAWIGFFSFKADAFLAKCLGVEALLNIFKEYRASISIFSGLSAFFFLLSILALPWMVCRIPEDFFLVSYHPPEKRRSMGVRWVIWGMKNLLGALVFLVGTALLFLPGQGLLTMLFGVILMDFPGKKKLVLKLVSMEKTQIALNWFRQKRQVKPLRFPTRGGRFEKTRE